LKITEAELVLFHHGALPRELLPYLREDVQDSLPGTRRWKGWRSRHATTEPVPISDTPESSK
jgi:hypothetical protein